MSAPILVTKLFIPAARPEIVPRPELLKRLNAGLERKLTLVSAPAGFGKTTLVSEWVDYLQSDSSEESQIDNKIAWISLDIDDNDPTRFLTYFIAALKQAAGIRDDLAESLMGILQSPQVPPIRDIATAIINEGAGLAGRLIIVMDDYHLIEAPLINEALTFLIDYLPPQLHLVFVTRDDPHFPLARLRAKGQMTELRAADLRFTPPEITTYLQQKLGIQLSPDEIAGLDAHTEGWITGLHLVALSLQGQENASRAIQDISGSHRFVLDYLLEEVLSHQPKEIQEFLVQTAVLNRLTGPLCDAVRFGMTAGDALTGQEILAELEHANLFIIPLDNERRWYRFHHLFSDLLRLRLHQTYFDQELNLHRRASAWYEDNGFVDEAIEHALCAREFERMTQLISAHYETILKRGEYTKVWRWFEEIPSEFLRTKPDLSVLNAWYLFAQGDLDEAELNLLAAEKHLQLDSLVKEKNSPDDLDPLEKTKLSGRVAGVRAFIASYRGDIPGIIQNAHQALDKLPSQDLAWRSMVAVALGDAYGMAGDMLAAYKARVEALEASKAGGNVYLTLLSGMKLAVTLRMQGQLQGTIDLCQDQLRLANEKGVSQMAVVGWLQAILAEVLAEINQLDEALSRGRWGVELTSRGDDIAMIGWSYLCLGRIHFVCGDIDSAENIFRKLDGVSRERHMPPFITGQISAWQARILLARNKLDAAAQWAETRGLKIDGEINQLNEGEYIAFARILLAQGQSDETISLLQRLFDAAEDVGRVSRMVEILIIKVLAWDASGNSDQALSKLEQALVLAEPRGFVRIFVDEGPSMGRLLYEAAARKIAPDYTQRLLSAFSVPASEQAVPSKSQTHSSELIEFLSERELEVLRLVAEGLPRQEIASKLVVSLNTVKSHIRNIYGKLGVNNQMQAVARARAFGILESD